MLLEQMNKSISLIAEQHGEIKENIGEINSRLGRVESEVETVKMAVMENSANIKVLRRDVSEIKVRQDRMEQKLDKNLANHDERITRLEDKINV